MVSFNTDSAQCDQGALENHIHPVGEVELFGAHEGLDVFCSIKTITDSLICTMS